jgi:hypothetical protein
MHSVSTSRAVPEAIQVLKLRLGRPFEPKLESLLNATTNDEAVTWLCSNEHWAIRACGLILAREALRQKQASYEVCAEACSQNLEHESAKTRAETIDLLGELTLADKNETWSRFGEELLQIARKNIALDIEERGMEAERNGMAETKQEEEDREVIPDARLPIELEITRTKKYSSVCISDFRGRVRANSSGASARIRLDSGAIVLMVHETVGWKALETSLKGINRVIQNYGPQFVSDDHLTTELVELFDDVVAHQNRFVREVGLQLADTLASLTGSIQGEAANEHGNVREELYHAIADGICDFNGQVRFAACSAARSLVRTRPSPDAEVELLETILAPVICMNRHYNAEGVKSLCQEAWKLAFPSGAAPTIAKRAETFVEVYLAEMKSSRDDLAREAACQALGELAAKVKCSIVESYAQEVESDLISQMQDSSWSVRAASCMACCNYVSAFPELLEPSATTKLMEALQICLTDPIWSIRDEAAITLGVLSKLYPEQKVLDPLLRVAGEWLVKAAEHDKAHKHCAADEEGPEVTGLVFSCCSAEPNVHFSKLPTRDWQYSDGAVRLLRELSLAHPAKVDSSMVMEKLAILFENLPKHHARNSMLAETAISAVPVIAQALGKRPFKRYLDPMIPPMITILSSGRHKTAHAAAATCAFLRKYLGEGIFKARVESCDPSFWEIIERNPPSSFENIHVSFKD